MTRQTADVSEEFRFNVVYVLGIAIVAALGGLLFGYDLMVISGAKQFYEEVYGLTGTSADQTFLQGWAISCCVVGCILGSIGVGKPSDQFGRTRLLKLSALLFLISAIVTGWAPTFGIFVFARLLGGIGMGMAATLSPIYIAEVSPARWRGRFVAVNQLTIVIGILLAQLVNYLILTSHGLPIDPATGKEVAGVALLDTWNGRIGWRIMFAAEALPALLFFVFMFLVPPSPRWLVKRGRDREAWQILAKIGDATYADEALEDIEVTLSEERKQAGFRELLKPRVAHILTVGVILAVYQQWCGINIIFMYAADLFRTAGFGVSDIFLQLVVIGSTNLLFTFVGMKLVDSLGRKPLMLAGSLGLAMTYVLIGLAFSFQMTGLIVVILALTAIAFFAATLGPVVWVMIAEIFPNRIRGVAVSVCVFSLWVANFILVSTFPTLNEKLGPAPTFWLYAGICVLGFFYIKAQIPETKGKTLEEIERELVD